MDRQTLVFATQLDEAGINTDEQKTAYWILSILKFVHLFSDSSFEHIFNNIERNPSACGSKQSYSTGSASHEIMILFDLFAIVLLSFKPIRRLEE